MTSINSIFKDILEDITPTQQELTLINDIVIKLKKLLDESVKHHGKLSDRIGGAFASAGMMGGGGETTIMSIIEALLIHGMIVIGDARMQHYGPLSIGTPDGNAVDACHKYGQKIAQFTKKLFE